MDQSIVILEATTPVSIEMHALKGPDHANHQNAP